jgi:hypothetical protein
MVDFHGLGVDVRFQGFLGIGQGSEFVWHRFLRGRLADQAAVSLVSFLTVLC